MKPRTFTAERIERQGAALLAYRVTCSGCDAVSYFALKRGGVPRPPPSIIVHFEKEGWFVGASPRKDACPLCRRRASPPRDARKEISMPEPRTINLVAHAAPRAEEPRVPNLDEKRLINMKLAEVYADGGYVTPWTDQRVADDLGVPRAWVTEIREGFYGPEGSNPLFDKYLVECAAIARLQAEITEDRKAAGEMARRATEAAAKVRTRCDELDGKIRDVQALGKRVERELGR